MDDLVKRLRGLADQSDAPVAMTGACLCEAANEIERLRDALRGIANHTISVQPSVAARWAMTDAP